jgi:hypothetical protein
MSSLVPFTEAALPSTILGRKKLLDVNKDIVTVAAFPNLSIKGKVFTLVQNNERRVLMKPDEPDEVMQSLKVAFLRINMASKTYYKKKYSEEDSEFARPDCSSMDGIAPDAGVPEPQSKKCAICPHNQWGSRVSEDNTGKGKACSDHARIAIADPRSLDKPMLLRVPPASLKPLREDALKKVKARQLQYNEVVFQIGFDREAPAPKLTFKPIGVMDDVMYAAACDQFETDIVRAIVGLDGTPMMDAPVESADELDAAVAAREVTRKAAAKPVVDDVVDVEPVAPPPKPKAEPVKAKPKAAAKPVVSDDLLGDLDAILGGSDD